MSRHKQTRATTTATRKSGAGPSGTGVSVAARRAAKRKFRIRLLIAAPILLALTAAGVRLVALPIQSQFAQSAYKGGNYSSAMDQYRTHRMLNVIDKWKPTFNEGTAAIKSGEAGLDYAAISLFRQSLKIARHASDETQCMISRNLGVAYEVTGDREFKLGEGKTAELEAVNKALAAKAAGQPYDTSVLEPGAGGKDPDPKQLQADAARWYEYAGRNHEEAEKARNAPACATADRPEKEREEDKEATDRLQEKQDKANQAQQSTSPGDNSGGDQQGQDQGEEDGGDQGDQNPGQDGQNGPEASPSPSPNGQGGEPPSPSPTQDPAEAERQRRLQEQNEKAQEGLDSELHENQDMWGDQHGNVPGGGTNKKW